MPEVSLSWPAGTTQSLSGELAHCDANLCIKCIRQVSKNVAAGNGRTHALRKRPHTAPSTLFDSEDPLDEALYNPRQVDDWGVNRDMQQEYRCC